MQDSILPLIVVYLFQRRNIKHDMIELNMQIAVCITGKLLSYLHYILTATGTVSILEIRLCLMIKLYAYSTFY